MASVSATPEQANHTEGGSNCYTQLADDVEAIELAAVPVYRAAMEVSPLRHLFGESTVNADGVGTGSTGTRSTGIEAAGDAAPDGEQPDPVTAPSSTFEPLVLSQTSHRVSALSNAAAPDGGQPVPPDPETAPEGTVPVAYTAPPVELSSSHRVRISSSDGTDDQEAFTLLDADKAREALASQNSSFILQEGRVRVTSTRRDNPLFSSETGDRDSGASSVTSIRKIEEQYSGGGGGRGSGSGPEDYLSWGGDEADDADDVTYPHRIVNMRPSNALRGAGPMRGPSDDDPPAEGARPLRVGGCGFGFGFATLDVTASVASSNFGDTESDIVFSLPTSRRVSEIQSEIFGCDAAAAVTHTDGVLRAFTEEAEDAVEALLSPSVSYTTGSAGPAARTASAITKDAEAEDTVLALAPSEQYTTGSAGPVLSAGDTAASVVPAVQVAVASLGAPVVAAHQIQRAMPPAAQAVAVAAAAAATLRQPSGAYGFTDSVVPTEDEAGARGLVVTAPPDRVSRRLKWVLERNTSYPMWSHADYDRGMYDIDVDTARIMWEYEAEAENQRMNEFRWYILERDMSDGEIHPERQAYLAEKAAAEALKARMRTMRMKKKGGKKSKNRTKEARQEYERAEEREMLERAQRAAAAAAMLAEFSDGGCTSDNDDGELLTVGSAPTIAEGRGPAPVPFREAVQEVPDELTVPCEDEDDPIAMVKAELAMVRAASAAVTSKLADYDTADEAVAAAATDSPYDHPAPASADAAVASNPDNPTGASFEQRRSTNDMRDELARVREASLAVEKKLAALPLAANEGNPNTQTETTLERRRSTMDMHEELEEVRAASASVDEQLATLKPLEPATSPGGSVVEDDALEELRAEIAKVRAASMATQKLLAQMDADDGPDALDEVQAQMSAMRTTSPATARPVSLSSLGMDAVDFNEGNTSNRNSAISLVAEGAEATVDGDRPDAAARPGSRLSQVMNSVQVQADGMEANPLYKPAPAPARSAPPAPTRPAPVAPGKKAPRPPRPARPPGRPAPPPPAGGRSRSGSTESASAGGDGADPGGTPSPTTLPTAKKNKKRVSLMLPQAASMQSNIRLSRVGESSLSPSYDANRRISVWNTEKKEEYGVMTLCDLPGPDATGITILKQPPPPSNELFAPTVWLDCVMDLDAVLMANQMWDFDSEDDYSSDDSDGGMC